MIFLKINKSVLIAEPALHIILHQTVKHFNLLQYINTSLVLYTTASQCESATNISCRDQVVTDMPIPRKYQCRYCTSKKSKTSTRILLLMMVVVVMVDFLIYFLKSPQNLGPNVNRPHIYAHVLPSYSTRSKFTCILPI